MSDNTNESDNTLRELELVYRRVEELEQEQAALRDQMEGYRAAFEYAGDSVFILDATGTRILDVNSNGARRLGYTRDELLAMNYRDIEVLPENGPSWESAISSTLVYECDYRCKDGTLTPVEVSSRPVVLDTTHIVQNVARDIRWRKAVEAEREQFIEDLDAFAHTVAHDLKGPLHLISGFADVLAMQIDDEEQQDTLQAIVRNARKMNQIVEGLLLLAQVRRQDEWSTDRLDMGSIVTEALQDQALAIEQAQAEVLLPDEWPVALGYAPWVGQIWANYISNAIKYGGQPPCIELGFDKQPGGMLRFWVRDNGPGLTQDEKDQLFAPFIRLDKARTSSVKGYGLGLSIVRRIADKLDGQVGVQSAPGKGSTFWFALPAA